jgi:hypothetical protein
MPAIGNAISLPFARMPTAAGGGGEPLNWFRTSLNSDDFDATLAAALASEHADDYVLVVDSINAGINNVDKDLFISGSAAATAELRMEAPGSITTWGNGKLNIAGPASGERTLSLDMDITIPVVAIVANQGSEIVGTVRIEGVGETKQAISNIEAAWQTEELHLTHLNVTNVFADGSEGDGESGETGANGGDIINGAAGSNGTNGDYNSTPATNGADGESVSTSSHGSAGGAGSAGGNRAVQDIYLNGCLIDTLRARNSNGGTGGSGGQGQSCFGGAGGVGGDSFYYGDYPTPGNGGNGGNGTCSSNGGAGGSGGNANQTVCTTHGQGSPSTVSAYYKTASGGSGGIGGSKGVGTGGAGGAAGNGYDDESPPGVISTGNPGTTGTGSSTGTNGANGTAGSNYVRALSDPNNKITFTNQI